MPKLKEECGLMGIYRVPGRDAAEHVYYGLFAQQHRGQESAGIATSDGTQVTYYKDEGLVQEVFDTKILHFLGGKHAIGHVRYSTTGGTTFENAQPLVITYQDGQLALAHNGNLVNTQSLVSRLETQGASFQSSTDSETILKLISRHSRDTGSLVGAVQATMEEIRGGYSILLLSGDKLLAFRDPQGLRPLCMGRLGESVVFASESCGLDAIGAVFERDVAPGEIVGVGPEGVESFQTQTAETHFCAFEYVYFARTDSQLEGLNVYQARIRMGHRLFAETGRKADLVIDIPDSGTAAAIGYAQASGIPFDKGFYRNAYIGRTFIKPSQDLREIGVNYKLSPIRATVAGKSVIMIDDSIVRGTTITRIVASLRKAGAREVHVMISSPAVAYSCYYGIDTPDRDSLIAAKQSVADTCRMIGADSLAHLSLEGLQTSLEESRLGSCLACFNGEYPVPLETS